MQVPDPAIVDVRGLPFRHFNPATAGSSGEERLEHLRFQMAGTAQVEPADRNVFDFAVTSSTWLLDTVIFIDGEMPALTMSRPASLIDSSPQDHYALEINPSDGQALDADGRHVRTTGSQVVIKDLVRPQRVTYTAGRAITVLLPRAEVDALLPGTFDLHGVVLQGASATILHSHLMSLGKHMANMSAAEAVGAKSATLYLLTASLAPSFKSLGLARPRQQGSLLQQAKRHIEEHLGHIDLDAERLCQHLHVSRSTLYRMFEPLGGVSAYVRERRLAKVHALLTDPDGVQGRQYLARIASDVGFSSASHFSRAFREQYGYSPMEARQLHPLLRSNTLAKDSRSAKTGRFRFGDWTFS